MSVMNCSTAIQTVLDGAAALYAGALSFSKKKVAKPVLVHRIIR